MRPISARTRSILHPRKCSFRKPAAAASSLGVTSTSSASIRSRTKPELVTTTASTRPSPSREKCTCSSVSPPATIATPDHAHAAGHRRQHHGFVRSSIVPAFPLNPRKTRIDLRLENAAARGSPSTRWLATISPRSAAPRTSGRPAPSAPAPAEVCGCSSRPSLASSAISFRTVAELKPCALDRPRLPAPAQSSRRSCPSPPAPPSRYSFRRWPSGSPAAARVIRSASAMAYHSCIHFIPSVKRPTPHSAPITPVGQGTQFHIMCKRIQHILTELQYYQTLMKRGIPSTADK